MADIRKKLIDLLLSVPSAEVIFGKREGKRYTTAWHIANHLIANGVTIQEWIPVTERLPELIPCNAGTAYSEAVIVWTVNRKAMIAVWDGVDFLCAASYWDAEGEEITHWMPLPTPPKGE